MADPDTEILEKGHVYFFYRPKVEEEAPASLDDIQRSYIVLKTPQVHRLLVLGRKKLPEPSKRSRPFWGFVEVVSEHLEPLQKALVSEDYSTATRGERHRPGARAAGQGHYAILRHQTSTKSGAPRSHTHFVYTLQLPEEEPPKGSPQDEMNISKQASYIIQVKNPDASAGAAASGRVPAKRTEPFPEELQEKLGSLRFASLDPPSFLDHEGCEFLLISAADDVAGELGENVASEIDDECGRLEGGDQEVLGLLQDSQKGHQELVEPLFNPAWEKVEPLESKGA